MAGTPAGTVWYIPYRPLADMAPGTGIGNPGVELYIENEGAPVKGDSLIYFEECKKRSGRPMVTWMEVRKDEEKPEIIFKVAQNRNTFDE